MPRKTLEEKFCS